MSRDDEIVVGKVKIDGMIKYKVAWIGGQNYEYVHESNHIFDTKEEAVLFASKYNKKCHYTEYGVSFMDLT